MKAWFVLLVSLLCPLAEIASAQSQPSTDIAVEAGHNTSASARYRGHPNGNAPAGNVSKLPMRSLLYPGSTTKIYARLMPFFTKGGDKDHVDVDYDSDDRNQVSRQVEDMISRGIQGAILDWYGPGKQHHDRVAKALREAAEAHSGFEFAITEDNGALKPCASSGCDVTQRMIDDLNYAYQQYESSPAYMKWHGRPVVFFFDPDKYIHDWDRVRHGVKGNPLFVFRNSGAFGHPQSDGGFGWLASQEGLPYLERFYRKAKDSGGKLTVGSVYKGFDDSVASWGKGNKIPQNCGQTWLDTFAVINRNYDRSHQLDAVQMVTWNDYEEGTELETGIDTCVRLSAQLSGNTLRWDLGGGNENAIDHFTIFASPDGRTLEAVGEAEANQHSFDLRNARVPAGTRSLLVKAVARAGLRNSISSPVPLAQNQ